jgi:hypothetical protein
MLPMIDEVLLALLVFPALVVAVIIAHFVERAARRKRGNK